MSTLGLAGFDASITGDGIRESAEALRGVPSEARDLMCYLNASADFLTLSHAALTCSRSVPRCPTTSRIA